MIEALSVWEKICADIGTDARDFYLGAPGITGCPELREKVLKQGSADFDIRYTDKSEEKDHYKTELYIRAYMDMHLKQNLVVLRKYLGNQLADSEHMVFVDFGCGPMTAGLALAEILSERGIDHKECVTYLGIDVSENMVAHAKWINRRYEIIDPDQLHFVQDKSFCPEMMDALTTSTKATSAILCLSFVMAPPTNKVPQNDRSAWVQKLAEAWDNWVSRLPNIKENRIVYLNPNKPSFHDGWDKLTKAFLAMNTNTTFSYKGGDIAFVPVPGLQKSKRVATARILGTKRL